MNKKKQEEAKILLGVLPKEEVRNILVAGEKTWKALFILSISISAIYAASAANAFYNDYPSDGIFYSIGALAATILVPVGIKTKALAKNKQLFVSAENQLKKAIAEQKKSKTTGYNLLEMDNLYKGMDDPLIIYKRDKNNQLLLKLSKRSYKETLQTIKRYNSISNSI